MENIVLQPSKTLTQFRPLLSPFVKKKPRKKLGGLIGMLDTFDSSDKE
jgi:hypothetical protein